MKRRLETDPSWWGSDDHQLCHWLGSHFPCSGPRVIIFECCLPQSGPEELRSSGRVPRAELH